MLRGWTGLVLEEKVSDPRGLRAQGTEDSGGQVICRGRE